MKIDLQGIMEDFLMTLDNWTLNIGPVSKRCKIFHQQQKTKQKTDMENYVSQGQRESSQKIRNRNMI